MEKETSEIAKLTERISKDPKSKLFVPLAEEHKKAGDFEMAIAVLTEGLKNNPGYVTAKSFLGRLLLDKGDLSGAQKEFEEVIKAIPDNVLAQRKLGEIHALQGRAQEALLCFRAVLAVNPRDPELKALVAEIEAGRDVRSKIAGPKFQPATGGAAPAAPTPAPSPAAKPLPPATPSALSVVAPKLPVAPVNITPSVEEEPEEVLVFESLDELIPVEAHQQQEAAQAMPVERGAEAGPEGAAPVDAGATGEESSHLVATERTTGPQPVSGSDAEPDHLDLSASGMEGFDVASVPEPPAPEAGDDLGSPAADQGISFFDSEQPSIDLPASDSSGADAIAAPDLLVPLTEPEFGSPAVDQGMSFFDSELPAPDLSAADSSGAEVSATPDPLAPETEPEFGSPAVDQGMSFFDSELLPSTDLPADDSSGFGIAASPDLSEGTDQESDALSSGLGDSFIDSETMQVEMQKAADASHRTRESESDIPVDAPETAASDDSSAEALVFDVEPVDVVTEAEPRITGVFEDDGQSTTPVTLDVSADDLDRAVPHEVPTDETHFDVEPVEEEPLTAQAGGSDFANEDEAVLGEVLPEADDFTTDTLAELYIAQGFYEKAIEIYERMLADRPNSKLLKDKLSNVRAMSSVSSLDDEQGTPVFFEAPSSPPVAAPQPVSEEGGKQWKFPGVEPEAKEYIPPPADDFESSAFDSGFAQVDYVQPEATSAVPPPAASQELPAQGEPPMPASPIAPALGKEQAIVRLDNWLKNIMKER